MEGIVIRSTGSWYIVRTEDGTTVDCRLRGQYRIKGIRNTNPVAVGDRVTIALQKDEPTAVIEEIHERHNHIIRKATNLSKASHIIAANIDQAVLVVTINHPRTAAGFIDRFLVTAEAYHIPAALVFNKIDLYNEPEKERLYHFMDVYSGIGYPCIEVSAKEGINIHRFIALMQDKVSLLTGHSGVGKSALLNASDPLLNLKTGIISEFSNKGKHTTTFAEMLELSFGGWIVDTPGIKEFGLYDFEKDTLAQRFPEMRALMSDCRFTNCTHIHEPGCAVKVAIEKGAIATSRYKSYLNMTFQDFTPENE
ncbi:MAG: ribosome small subunit-dependent GTPase A [Bacteroidales bacterium]|nr:ribosome small subunit-dependent GTPase A [Bacteroidales bacterium]